MINENVEYTVMNQEMNIHFTHSGVYRIDNGNKVVEKIHMIVDENIKCVVEFTLNGEHLNVEKEIVLHENSKLNIVYKNKCLSFTSKEHVVVNENATIEAGYFDLNEGKTYIKATYDLVADYATAHILTTTLANNEKKYDIEAHHIHPNTYSNIDNYGMCMKDGKYTIIASGKIDKHAKGSKSHQATRVLTLADKELVSVTPLLLIDENDVEASHACSIGQMNEDHLYYLQTRGLNETQALGLLTLSYVLPILNIVEDSEIKETLQKEIEYKVGLSC